MSRPDSSAGELSSRRTPRPWRRFWHRFAAVDRWLHIYLSLLGFTALLFFALTGITLNHPTWFGADRQYVTELQGKLSKQWLKPVGRVKTEIPEADADDRSEVDKFAIVEHLRARHRLRGAVSEFRIDKHECIILFKGPAYAADVYIDRTTGTYKATVTAMGMAAFINDLHKGRDTGFAWSLIIDLSSLLMIVISITGLILIFFLKRKRRSGLITAFVGTILFACAMTWLTI